MVYVDFAANAIKMAISADNGATWTTETAATASFALLDPFVSGSPQINGSATCKVWAVTIPSTQTGAGHVFNPFDNDPAIFQETPTTVCFRGDYQEVWFWPYVSGGGRYQTLWAGNPVSGGAVHDIYLSSVQ